MRLCNYRLMNAIVFLIKMLVECKYMNLTIWPGKTIGLTNVHMQFAHLTIKSKIEMALNNRNDFNIFRSSIIIIRGII